MSSLVHSTDWSHDGMDTTAQATIAWRDHDHEGLNGVISMPLATDLVCPDATVNEFISVLNGYMPQPDPAMTRRYVLYIEFYGERIDITEPVSSLLPQVSSVTCRLVAVTRTIPIDRVFINVRYLYGSHVKSFTCDLRDTVQDVKTHVRTLLNIAEDQQPLVYQGKVLEDHQLLSFYGITNQSDVELDLRLDLRTISADPITITVKSLTGKIFSLRCDPRATISDVKRLIEDKQGLPPTSQRIAFDRKILKDEWQLVGCGIDDSDVIYLVFPGCGARGMFVMNLGNDSVVRVPGFSSEVPAWRQVGIGLNVEGRCENQQCQAYQQKVLQRVGIKRFNFMADKVSCPMCRECTSPISCGFYDCTWKYEGVVTQDKSSVSSQWKVADGDEFHRFKPPETHAGVVWDGLIIIVKPMEFTKDPRFVEEHIPPTSSSTGEWCSIC